MKLQNNELKSSILAVMELRGVLDVTQENQWQAAWSTFPE